MLASVKDVLFHRIQTEGYVTSRNPLFILLTLLNLVYSTFIQIWCKQKTEGWEIHEKNAYHGPSRWAKEKEILDGNFIAKPNRNIIVVCGLGSYKTQSFVMTNVLYETENSIVITDPKAEVYEKMAAFKEVQCYEVHVINFMNM